jgi:hypothetical protein
VVAGFLDRVKNIAKLDDVAAPASVADVDTGSGHVVNGTVAHGDVLREVEIDSSGLLFDAAGQVNEVIIDDAVSRIIVALRSGSAVEVFQFVDLAVVEQRIPGGLLVSDEGNSAGSCLCDLATAHFNVAIVIVDENRVTANLVEEAVFHRAIFRSLKQDGASAINSPVGAEQGFSRVHDGSCSVPEGKALESNKFYGCPFGPSKFHQPAELGGFDDCGCHFKLSMRIPPLITGVSVSNAWKRMGFSFVPESSDWKTRGLER